MDHIEILPFLRWAGGKTKLIAEIRKFVPDDIDKRTYWEPFVGAGSLFFKLSPTNGIISDLNSELINCYKKIAKEPDVVYDALIKLVKNNSETFYYTVRDKYNLRRDSYTQAARFIYLNKVCYNGLYRVNLKGEFNVPFGKIENPNIPTRSHLRTVSQLLQNNQIFHGDYITILKKAKRKDFIYLDPPYPPLNKTSFFTNYTKELFGIEAQGNLAKYANDLRQRGCLVLISNADTKEIRKLYQGWNINKLNITRFISCKTNKVKVGEVIISNY